MKKILTLDWLFAALIRAVKTMAQAALSVVTIGLTMEEIPWPYVISIAIVAGIYSMLMSLKGLPEVGVDGSIVIEKLDPTDPSFLISLDKTVDELQDNQVVKLKVGVSQ